MLPFEDYFNAWEIEIIECKVPDKLTNPKHKDAFYFLNETSFLLIVPSVAKFLVTANLIQFERSKDASMLEIFAFLSSTVLGAALKLQGKLVFHGNAVFYNDQSYLICGGSGSGKSSIAAAMVRFGGKHISDEIAVIEDLGNGEFYVKQGFPFIRLWEEVCDWLNIPDTNREYLRENIRKIRFNIPKESISQSNFPLDHFVVSHISRPNEVELDHKLGVDKVISMLNQVYRKDWNKIIYPKDLSPLNVLKLARQINFSTIILREGFTPYKDIIKILEKNND